MKCPRHLCRLEMLVLSDGGLACPDTDCGSVVYLRDAADCGGLSASSKPDNNSGRNRATHLARLRERNASPERKAQKHAAYAAKRESVKEAREAMDRDRRILSLSDDGHSAESIAVALSAGAYVEEISAEYVGQVVSQAYLT